MFWISFLYFTIWFFFVFKIATSFFIYIWFLVLLIFCDASCSMWTFSFSELLSFKRFISKLFKLNEQIKLWKLWFKLNILNYDSISLFKCLSHKNVLHNTKSWKYIVYWYLQIYFFNVRFFSWGMVIYIFFPFPFECFLLL